MKPKGAKTYKEWCKSTCPYMIPWEHPFWNHTAWCSYMLKDLFWYDGAHLCQCKREEPHPSMKLVDGRTENANSFRR